MCIEQTRRFQAQFADLGDKLLALAGIGAAGVDDCTLHCLIVYYKSIFLYRSESQFNNLAHCLGF